MNVLHKTHIKYVSSFDRDSVISNLLVHKCLQQPGIKQANFRIWGLRSPGLPWGWHSIHVGSTFTGTQAVRAGAQVSQAVSQLSGQISATDKLLEVLPTQRCFVVVVVFYLLWLPFKFTGSMTKTHCIAACCWPRALDDILHLNIDERKKRLPGFVCLIIQQTKKR